MKLNIQHINEMTLNCLENSIVASAKWYNTSYQLMFMRALRFSYEQENSQIIGDNIILDKDDQLYLLEKFHGYCVYMDTCESIKELYDFLSDELSNNHPASIIVDVGNCPWRKEYCKESKQQLIMVAGIDENNLYCIDLGRLDNVFSIEQLPLQNYKNSEYTFYSYNISENKKYHDDKIYIKALEEMQNTLKKNLFCNIQGFASDLLHDDLFIKIDPNSDKNEIALFKNTNEIAYDFIKFSEAMRYFALKYKLPEFNNLSEKMHDLGQHWRKIRGMLLKAYFIKETLNILKKASVKIQDTYNLQCELFDNTLTVIDHLRG
jgi:hypothetical protein